MSIETYFCLCCLSTEQLTNLFGENPETNYAMVLKDLFAINATDDEDTYICKECITKLNASLCFKRKVLNNINVLQDMGLMSIRKENGDLIIQKTAISPEDVNSIKDIDIEMELNLPIQIKEVKSESTDQLENKDVIRHILDKDQVTRIKDDMTESIGAKLYEVPDDLTCTYCGTVLVNVYGFHSHMNMHFPNHICEFCGKGFMTERRLKCHKNSHNRGPFVCQECGCEFHNHSTYSQHKKLKHTGVRKYACTMCPVRFNTLSVRARHVADAHQGHVGVKCAYCSKQFLTAANLNAHMKYKHLKITNHSCNECDAKFYHKQDLVSHMAKHTGLMPFKCTLCAKRYRWKKSLVVHLKKHSNDKRFGCDTCGKRFIQKCSLISHIKTHNPIKNLKVINKNKIKAGSAIKVGQVKVQKGQPKVEKGQPKEKKGQPKVEKGQPKVGKGQPTVEKGQPKVEKAQPTVEKGQSKVEKAQPTVEKGQSKVEKGQPTVEKGQPKVEKAQPTVEKGQSKVEKGQPIVDLVKAKVISGQDKVDLGQVKVNNSEIKVANSLLYQQIPVIVDVKGKGESGQPKVSKVVQTGQSQVNTLNKTFPVVKKLKREKKINNKPLLYNCYKLFY